MTGQQIRAARERAQLTQQQLAAKIGVGLRTVSNWERGETVPKNRMAAIEAFFAEQADDPGDDVPLRRATEAQLLAELLRRNAERTA